MQDPTWAVHAGQAFHTARSLRPYDVFVHGLSNPLVWGCPTRLLVDWYTRHLGRSHCDVGVGTGYLLQRACSLVPVERLVLVDLHGDNLDVSAERLAPFSPVCVRGDAMEPLHIPGPPFDSVGLGYLLHCVPGALGAAKAVVFDHLSRLLAPEGVLFGATLLGAPRANTRRARALMALYNQGGIFHNRGDSADGLRHALANHFAEYEVHQRGEVALFAARRARPRAAS